MVRPILRQFYLLTCSLESENNTEKTDSSDNEEGHENSRMRERKKGDNNSDSEDSDFIQFESKGNTANAKINGELSISNLTDPFSSSDSEEGEQFSPQDNIGKPVDMDRKNALIYQKELRQLNNVSLVENLHVEKVYLYIQMQLCRKDTLKDWLKTNCENRDKTTIFDLFYQIVDAVEYVHSQDLIHRDLTILQELMVPVLTPRQAETRRSKHALPSFQYLNPSMSRMH